MRQIIRAQLGSSGPTPAVVTDMVLSTTDWRTELDGDTGARVTMTVASPGNSMTTRFYLVQEGGEWRLFASSFVPGRLGIRALQLVDGGKNEAARQWLVWAREEFDTREGDLLTRPPFLAFWNGAADPTEDQVRYAAAALAAMSDAPDVAVPVLLAGSEKAADAESRLRFDYALATALMFSKRPAEAVAVTERVRAARPDSQAAFAAFTAALFQAGRFDDLRQVASERLLKVPDDVMALRSMASAAGAMSQWTEVGKSYQRIVDLGKAQEIDYNNLAWNALVRGVVDDAAIEFARKAALFNRAPSVAGMHTLAALYAETGSNADAREILLRQMDMKGNEEPDSNDWLIFGRLAENYGEIAVATAAYRRVTPPEDGVREAGSSYWLAQRRLSALTTSEKASTAVRKDRNR
jgi:tetratricopeptide (TPR) repeat protein